MPEVTHAQRPRPRQPGVVAPLSDADRKRISGIIATHRGLLEQSRGFIGARPGFRVRGGELYREPSIVAYVRVKLPEDYLTGAETLPREIEGIPVDVTVADPTTQLALATEATGLVAAAAFTPPTYTGIPGDPIDASFTVEKPILCHVGPDSGWVVLRDFFAATRKGLVAAIYDFNAEYLADTLIDAVKGHHFPIRLAIDNGLSTSEEIPIQQRLEKRLAANYEAAVIVCRAGARFPSAYHEKVAVRDGSAFWLSSGNWSHRSQPKIDPIGDPGTAAGMYGKGNREWHLIVEDGPLAKMFARYIEHDREQAKHDARALAPAAALAMPDVFVPLDELRAETITAAAMAVPAPVAPEKLPKTGGAVKVRPLLSPDNYARRVTELIKGATKRLYLQYAYIKWSAAPQDTAFREMLEHLAVLSRKKDFDLRIIVSSSDAAADVRVLAEHGFNEKVFQAQSSIHNKGIVADGKRALVSSQNWSGDGFLRNRDAGLIVENSEIAEYFERVFLDDWAKRANPALKQQRTAILAAPGEPTPPGMIRMRWDDYYPD
jgi:hypothetical protein